jgi:hypothetical protein
LSVSGRCGGRSIGEGTISIPAILHVAPTPTLLGTRAKQWVPTAFDQGSMVHHMTRSPMDSPAETNCRGREFAPHGERWTNPPPRSGSCLANPPTHPNRSQVCPHYHLPGYD